MNIKLSHNDKENNIRIIIEELFTKNNYKPTRYINGTVYKSNNVDSSLYIDTKLSYKGHIKINNNDICVEGHMDTILKDAYTIIEYYSTLHS